MNSKPLLIVMGEPYSVFIEIFLKTYKKIIKNKVNKPVLLIGSFNLLRKQNIYFKYGFKIKKISIKNISNIKNNTINVLDIKLNFKNIFADDCKNRIDYINKCFAVALKILKKDKAIGLINGPISKNKFLKKKFMGITEYLASKTKSNNTSMVIYNKKLAVSPITTHLPIKKIAKIITRRKIQNKVYKVNKFYENVLNLKPKIAILGLNPHCESIDKYSEEDKIITPAINNLKKENINITGPFPADTFFIKKNLKKYDLVFGMYHDQVLTPMKTIFNFDAVNLTVGLPFIRLSPDHGPNESMISKNLSNPISLIKSIKFFDKVNAD